MKVDKELILKALKNVIDPDLKRDIVTLNMVKEIRIEEKTFLLE